MKQHRRHLFAAAALWVFGMAGVLLAEHGVRHLDVQAGDLAFTLVGQVINTPPDQSSQFGYLPTITGLTELFSSPTQDETTAFFTFFTQATTKAIRHDGPLTIVERVGTTTVYYNVAPHANFADPSSFQDGQAVLVLSLEQHVVIDTSSGVFTVVNLNDVESASPFEQDGGYLLAYASGHFQVNLTGHLDSSPPPNGHFAGYAVQGRPVARIGRIK